MTREEGRAGVPAAVALLAKTPAPGRVKTRLVPPLTPEEAAAVARACLEATLRWLLPGAGLPCTLFLDGEPMPWIASLAAARGIEVAPQAPGDLGARVLAAFRALRAAGAARVIAVGADSPTLPRARIAEAARALEEADVVLGPTEDGGYYLVGARRGEEVILRDIPWSTERVLEVTLARAAEAGLNVRLLPAWYDVDGPDDVKRLAEEVRRAVDGTAGAGGAVGAGAAAELHARLELLRGKL